MISLRYLKNADLIPILDDCGILAIGVESISV